MLDLEDSVPPEQKEEARRKTIAVLLAGDWGVRVRAVRINAMDTPYAYRDLIEVVEQAGQRLDVVVVPKVNDPCEIKAVAYLLDQIERARGLSRRIGIEASVETAAGMLRIADLATSCERLEALIFGVADYAASLGMLSKGISGHGDAEEFCPGHRWHYPLSRMAMAAKAAGLAAIDAPFGVFQDAAGLERSCLLSAALGYDGKWAVHPQQLETINRAYSPTEADAARSRSILDAYERARQRGEGSFAVDGKMVDAASIRLARMVCSQWEAMAHRRW
jgi:citrate lyase beta subunit